MQSNNQWHVVAALCCATVGLLPRGVSSSPCSHALVLELSRCRESKTRRPGTLFAATRKAPPCSPDEGRGGRGGGGVGGRCTAVRPPVERERKTRSRRLLRAGEGNTPVAHAICVLCCRIPPLPPVAEEYTRTYTSAAVRLGGHSPCAVQYLAAADCSSRVGGEWLRCTAPGLNQMSTAVNRVSSQY